MAAARKLRLAVLLEDLDFGGTQRYATHLLKGLDRGLIEPELWTLRGGRDFLGEMQASGVPMRHMSHSRKVGP
ncbi:MAG: glycosyl transferase, partial [Hyphomicrobiales bacterium]